jgi:hypothetical protein
MDETETDDAIEALRQRAETLERELRETTAEAERRLIRAELKAEAVRAGMVDLDGLKLLDLSAVRLGAGGEVEGAAALMSQLRRGKPWLFGQASTSSSAAPPPSAPPRTKLATEMNEEEWRAARRELLRRR